MLRSYFWNIFIGLALIVGAFAIFGNLEEIYHSPAESVKQQLATLKNRSIEDAYYSFMSKNYQLRHTLTDFKSFLREFPILLDQTSPQLLKVQKLNNNRIVSMKLKMGEERFFTTQFLLVSEKGEWKIETIQFLEPIPASDSLSHHINQEIKNFIIHHFQLIKEGKIAQAYEEDFSILFKTEISFDSYETFISKYPILSDYEEFEIENKAISSSKPSVSVKFRNLNNETYVEYQLKEEKENWKIEGIKLQFTSHQMAIIPEFEELIEKSETFLQLLAHGEIKEAYENSTTKEFRTLTPFENFENFIEKFPLLREHTGVEFGERSIQNGIGKIQVLLINETKKLEVEFLLVLVEGQWKIQGLQVSYNFPIST